MTLSKVGASAANYGANLSVGGTVTATFVPTSTWNAGDLLILAVGSGALSGSATYFGSPGDIDYTTGWYDSGDKFDDNGPAWLVYHWVTAAEVGGSNIVLTLTLNTVSTVGAGNGVMLAYGGIGVRGGATMSHLYTPADSSDTDMTVFVADNINGVYPLVTKYWTGTAGEILYYIEGTLNMYSDLTAWSVTWTGPTELDDDFQANAHTPLTPDGDLAWASAYRLLAGTDYPADTVDVVATKGAGHTGDYAARFIIVLEANSNVSPDYEYPYERRQLSVKALPYHLTSGVLDGIEL